MEDDSKTVMTAPDAPSRKIWYQSTQEARKRRRGRWKMGQGESRISDLDNCLGQMRLRTQEEVAKILGISRQRVQQIERLALWKVRKLFKASI